MAASDYPSAMAALRRRLDHILSHQLPPPAPPALPSPPSPPPSYPPPPPLPFVLSGATALGIMASLCFCLGVGAGINAYLAKKRGTTSLPVETEEPKEGKEGEEGKEGDEKTLEGPKELRKRGCTDILCLFIFIFFWFGAMYIMYLATTVGDPYAVLYGKDYLGNRCGVGAFADRKKIIFPRLDKDVLEQSAIATTAPWKLVLYGLCVEECPNVTDPAVCFNDPGACIVYDYGAPSEWRAAGGKDYYFQVLPTISLVNRCIPIAKTDASGVPDRCAWPQCDNITNPWMECDAVFPTLWLPRGFMQKRQCEIKYSETTVHALASQEPSPVVDQIAAKMAEGQAVVEAIMEAQHELWMNGILMPVLLGFAWLIVLRFFAKTITYVMLAGIGVGLFLLTAYLFIITGLLGEIVADLMASNMTRTLMSRATELHSDISAGERSSGDGLGDLGSGFDPAASLASMDDVANDVTALLPPSLAAEAANAQGDDSAMWRLGAWFFLVFTCVYWVLMFLWRAKIRLAATLVKESSLVIKDQPFCVLAPGATFGAKFVLLLFLILGMLFLGTADITSDHFTGANSPLTASATFAQMLQAINNTVNDGDLGEMASEHSSLITTKNVCYTYILFAFLWTNECFNNVQWTALSGSYSYWYFFRRDPKVATRFPLAWAVYRVFRFHLGTVCFGSFIIAAVQLVRIGMMILDKQTKKLQESNQMMKYAIKCAQCALYCLEKCLKFITNYCYIYVALQGSSFCFSCIATFKLIMGQPAQLAMNTLVRTILSLIQMIGIPALCAFITNASLVAKMHPQPMYPTGCVLVMALVIAKSFAIVFACVLDTLFVCCVRDKADYKAAFMSDALYSAFGFDPAEREGGGGGGDGDGDADKKLETTQQL